MSRFDSVGALAPVVVLSVSDDFFRNLFHSCRQAAESGLALQRLMAAFGARNDCFSASCSGYLAVLFLKGFTVLPALLRPGRMSHG